jgi:phage-related holin
MITIVLGLAAADFLTGLLKACVKGDLSSRVMRRGGINKICELVVMVTACGLEYGITLLGGCYQSPELAAVAGLVASGLVFLYIVCMELISILENYGEINPDAVWVRRLAKKLRNFESSEK